MLVRDVMTTAVKTARPDDLIGDIALGVCLNQISGMPVVDNDGRIVGVISEKDILWGMFPVLHESIRAPAVDDFEALEDEYKDIVHMRVSELMTTRVVTVGPDLPLLQAAAIMFRNRIRRIPVAQDGRLVGIVSMGDIHNTIFCENFGAESVRAASRSREA